MVLNKALMENQDLCLMTPLPFHNRDTTLVESPTKFQVYYKRKLLCPRVLSGTRPITLMLGGIDVSLRHIQLLSLMHI